MDWFPIADSWDLETNSLDEDGLPLRPFIRCFIPRKAEHDKNIPIVCIKTMATSNISLLAMLVVVSFSSLVCFGAKPRAVVY